MWWKINTGRYNTDQGNQKAYEVATNYISTGEQRLFDATKLEGSAFKPLVAAIYDAI